MSTSANVIDYTIYLNSEEDTIEPLKPVGYFSKHLMCTYPDYAELLKYQPLKDYIIIAHGYDEDEEYWEDERENLEVFIGRMKTNKYISPYLKGEKTAEQALQALKETMDELHRKLEENWKMQREKRIAEYNAKK